MTAAALLTAVAPSQSAIEDDVFTNARWKVSVELPSNWQPTEQTAYPNILLWLERRDPRGVILFAAERVDATLDAQRYAQQTSKLLVKMGFRVRAPQLHTTTGAFVIDFENDGAFLRQALLIKGQIGYTLTLSASTSRLRGLHLRAFDTMLRKIQPLRAAPRQSDDDDDGDDRDDGGGDGDDDGGDDGGDSDDGAETNEAGAEPTPGGATTKSEGS